GVGICEESSGRKLRGKLAAARVYAKELSVSEIQSRYRADKGENIDAIAPGNPNVLAWYDFHDAYTAPRVTGITLNKTSSSIKAGSTLSLIATVAPINAENKNITWKSNNPSVATVDQKGNVKAIKAGKATITATTVDGAKTATCIVTVTDLKNEWIKQSGKWYYYASDVLQKNKWIKSSNKWYYVDSSGVMATGWKKISGKWYYLNSDGSMITGWKKLSGKWYYLNSDGSMITGWKKLSGKWYYFDGSGKMFASTTKKIGGKTYKFSNSGICLNP
ncbi:MAG: choline-binding protein, partial [Oscillospiraceae bacterium]|nr:choline-binding protein [Oscillospiraceae bacterium]